MVWGWDGGGKRKEVAGGRRNLYSLAGSRDGAQGLGASSPKSQQLQALALKGGLARRGVYGKVTGKETMVGKSGASGMAFSFTYSFCTPLIGDIR